MLVTYDISCDFERPDQEIMRTLLNKCPDSKFQEKAFLADWDETCLTGQTDFSRKILFYIYLNFYNYLPAKIQLPKEQKGK